MKMKFARQVCFHNYALIFAAGWDGAPKKSAPGFPDNGQWTVRWENLSRAP
jgi:hypothetical protein